MAVEWGVIEQMPCTIRLLKVTRCAIAFYDFDEFERLVAAARETELASESSCPPKRCVAL